MSVHMETDFGEEWKSEMMRWRKADIIDGLAEIAKENVELKKQLKTART
nr:hypothetical protein [Allomuricauda sp.]